MRTILPFGAMSLFLLTMAPQAAAQQPSPSAPNNCATTCSATGGFFAAEDDRARAANSLNPLFADLRTCMSKVGAGSINPQAIIRFDRNGTVASFKLDLSGYEDLPCAADANQRVANMSVKSETTLKCEYKCGGKVVPMAPAAPVAPAPLPPGPGPSAATPPPASNNIASNASAQTGDPPAVNVGLPPPSSTPPPNKDTPAADPDEVDKGPWYGWQTLISDGVALGLFGATFIQAQNERGDPNSTMPVTAPIGMAVYFLGAPTAHWIHKRVGIGFASFGLRWIPLVLGGIVFAALYESPPTITSSTSAEQFANRNDGEERAFIGLATTFATGLIGMAALDAAVFAYDKPKKPKVKKTKPHEELSLQPMFDVRPNYGFVGFGGRF